MIPIDKVREIISKHQLLEKELSSDKIDKNNYAKKSKEYSDLNDVLTCAKQYLSFNDTERFGSICNSLAGSSSKKLTGCEALKITSILGAVAFPCEGLKKIAPSAFFRRKTSPPWALMINTGRNFKKLVKGATLTVNPGKLADELS